MNTTPRIARFDHGASAAPRVRALAHVAGFLVAMLLTFLHPAGAAANPPVLGEFPGTMRYRAGKLTAHFAAVPRARVLEEVTRLTGVHVRYVGGADAAPISMQFTDLPVEVAVSRILRGESFMLFFLESQTDGVLLADTLVLPRVEQTGTARNDVEHTGTERNDADQEDEEPAQTEPDLTIVTADPGDENAAAADAGFDSPGPSDPASDVPTNRRKPRGKSR